MVLCLYSLFLKFGKVHSNEEMLDFIANPLPMAMQLGAAWRYNPYLGFLVLGGRGSSKTYRTIMG